MLIKADFSYNLFLITDGKHLKVPAVMLHFMPVSKHLSDLVLCHSRIDLLQSRDILCYEMS